MMKKSISLFRLVGATLLLAYSCLCGMAYADSALESLGNGAALVRKLAENDAPRAYQQALRLQAQLPATATPADKARVLNLLARTEIYLAQTEISGKHAQQALEAAKLSGDRIAEAEAYLNLSLVSIHRGSEAANTEPPAQALKLLQGSKRPDLVGEAMLRMAVVQRRIGMFDSSLILSMQAMDIARHEHDTLALYYAHYGLAIADDQSGIKPGAHEHYRQMLELAQALHMKQLEADAIMGMADTGDEPREAERAVHQAIALYRQIGVPFNLARALFALSHKQAAQGRTTEALQTLEEVLAIYRQHPNPIGTWWALNARSEMFQALGRLKEANADARQAQTLAQEIKLPLYLSGSARRLAELAAAGGDMKRAYELSRESESLAEQQGNDKVRALMFALGQHYQEDSMQQEIDGLLHNNEQQAARNRQLVLVVSGSLLLLTIFAWLLLRLRQAHTRLHESDERVRSINARLEQQVHDKDEELRRQAFPLDKIVDAIADPIFVKDREHRLVLVNEAFCQMAGKSREALLGQSHYEAFPEMQADEFWERDEAVFKSGEVSLNEDTLTGGDGKTRITQTKKAAFVSAAGELGMVGVMRDVTERKRMETELREQAAFQASLLNALNEVGMQLMTIEEGRIRYVSNRKLAHEFGYSDADLEAGAMLAKIIHPDDRVRVLDLYQRRLAGENVPSFYELALVTRAGERREYETSIAVIPDSNPVRVITVGKDITARKHAEQYERFRSRTLELLAGGAPLRNILEGIVRGVEQLDPRMLCSILLLDSQGKRLGEGVAPSLPDFYNAAVEGLEIGMGVGSCGTAAFTGERVIVEDIQAHPYWSPYKELAASAGLRACWSQPVRSSSGQVLGTFAIYHREAHAPTVSDISLIEKTANLASIAIERTRMEEALRAREQEFRSMAESSPDNIVRYDREGRHRYLNASLVRVLGLGSAEEVIGKRPSEVWPDGRFGKIEQAAQQAVESGSTKVIEMLVSDENHGLAYNHIFVVPEFGVNGDIVGALAFGRDVTAIREAELKLRHYIDNLPGLAYTFRLTRDGRASFPYVSAAVDELYGVKADEVVEDFTLIHNAAHPDDRPRIEAGIAESARELTPFRIESRVCRPGLPERWLDVRSVPEPQPDGSILWYGIMLDITERKRMEAELRLKEEVLDQARIGVYLIDEKACITYVNNEACRALGYSREELLTKSIPEIDAGKSLDESLSVRQKTLDEGAFTFETMHTRSDGGLFPVEIWASTLDIQGKKIGVALAVDISERKRMEQELRRQSQFQQSLLSGLRDAGIILVVIENGCFVYTNDHYVGCQLGYAEGALPETVNFIELIHPEDRPRIAEMHRDRLAGKPVPDTYEIGALGGDGSRREYEFHVTLVPDTNPPQTLLLTLRIDERKRQEDELRRREQEFRVLVENSPDVIVRYDRELRRSYINPAWEAANGIAVAEALGKRPSEISVVVSGWVQEFEDKLRMVLESGEPAEIEIGGKDHAGVMKYFAMRVVPEFGKDGKVASLLTVANDITGRKKMQDAVRHNQEMLADAQKLAQLGSWDWDVVTNRVEWSEMAYEIYTPDQRPDDPGFEEFKSSVHPDDLERVVAAVQSAFEHDTPFDLDHRVVSTRRGVRTVHAQGKVFRDADGKPVRMVGTVQDITERKGMEEQLAESRNFLRKIMDGISDPIFVKDRRHTWIEFNQAFCDLVGYPREVILGKSDYDFLPHEQADVFWEKDEEVFDTGKVSLNEESITGKNGIERFIQTKKEAVVLESGREALLVGVIRDITERREMELAREVALSEAVRLGQLRSAFMAQMSHELRTPLNGILGYAQNLLLDGTLTDKQRTSLNIIQHSGDHLLSLLNDVLDHAKIEADKLSLNIDIFLLEVLLRTVIELIKARAEQSRLKFSCQLGDGLPSLIRGDEQRLRQVLLNLLSNAVKFTESGEVTLHVSRTEQGRIRFEVRDTGVGIDASKLESIFMPFEQAGDGRQFNGGTGLGLAISRKLVRLMGGDIKVKSKPGKGSVFSFELEQEAAQQGQLDRAVAQQAAALPLPDERPLCLPGQAELEALYELAKRGNMRNIALRAATLAELDERYGGFAVRMMELANSYQSKAILQFIELCMTEKSGLDAE